MELATQITWLFMLAMPVACIAWTVTQEEIFREPRTYCIENSQKCKKLLQRKFFYVFTCEYCFSHYVTVVILIIAKFHFLFDDWRGYLMAGFSIVWVANIYMSLYALIRTDLKKVRIISKVEERKLQEESNDNR